MRKTWTREDIGRIVDEVARSTQRRISRLPELVYIAGAITFLTAVLLVMHHLRSYNSDDVALQVMLSQWERGFHHVMRSGADNFFFKLPYYWLTQSLSGRTGLLITVLVFLLGNLVFYWLALRRIAREIAADSAKFAGLVLFWLVPLSSTFLNMLITINTRNIELGILISVAAWLMSYLYGASQVSVRRSALIAGLAFGIGGLIISSDPYLMYAFVLPFIGLLAWEWRDRPLGRIVTIGLVLVAALIGYKMWDTIFYHLGAIKDANPRFVTIDHLSTNVRYYIQGILDIFDADLFGMSPRDLQVVIGALNISLLAVVIRGVWRKRRKITPGQRTWLKFNILQFGVLSVLFIFTDVVLDPSGSRYLVEVPFSIGILMVIAYHLGSVRYRLLLAMLLVATTMANVACLGLLVKNSAWQVSGNQTNRAIAARLQELGITKGYGSYWDAHINTYFTGNKIDIIPVECANDHFSVRIWLTEDGVTDKPSSHSFMLYSSDPRVYGGSCSIAAAPSQFGQAISTEQLPGGVTLFVYDYDITSKIPRP